MLMGSRTQRSNEIIYIINLQQRNQAWTVEIFQRLYHLVFSDIRKQ